jgi:hypothetical protein
MSDAAKKIIEDDTTTVGFALTIMWRVNATAQVGNHDDGPGARKCSS